MLGVKARVLHTKIFVLSLNSAFLWEGLWGTCMRLSKTGGSVLGPEDVVLFRPCLTGDSQAQRPRGAGGKSHIGTSKTGVLPCASSFVLSPGLFLPPPFSPFQCWVLNVVA